MDSFTSLWDDASADIEAEASLRALTSARVAVAGSWPFLAAAVDRADLSNRLALAANQITDAAAAQGITAEALGASLVADWEQMQKAAKSYYVTDGGKKVGGPYDSRKDAQDAIDGGDVEGDSLSVSGGDDSDSDSDSDDSDDSDSDDVNGDGQKDSDGDGNDSPDEDDEEDEDGDKGGNPFAKKEAKGWDTPAPSPVQTRTCDQCKGQRQVPVSDSSGWGGQKIINCPSCHGLGNVRTSSKVAINDAEESQASSERWNQTKYDHLADADEDDEDEGTDYSDDDQDPHYGRDAHLSSRKTASHEPIGYTYEADIHCPGCAEKAHGRSARGFIGEDAHDSEGNPVHVIAPWDETNPHGEHCGTCGERIAEPYDHNPSLCGSDTCSGVVKDGRVLQYPGPKHHASLFPVIALQEGEDPLDPVVEDAPSGEGEPEAVATHTTQFTSKLDAFAAVLREHTEA